MKIVIIIIVATFSICLLLCQQAGFFDPITIASGKKGPYYLVYRQHSGPYQKLQYAMQDVAQYLDKRGIPSNRGFSVLYTDPTKTDALAITGIAGCITDTTIAGLVAPYSSAIIGSTDAVAATLRLRTFFSIMTASWRIRPAVQKHLRAHDLQQIGPVIEIFDRRNRVITYVTIIKKP